MNVVAMIGSIYFGYAKFMRDCVVHFRDELLLCGDRITERLGTGALPFPV